MDVGHRRSLLAIGTAVSLGFAGCKTSNASQVKADQASGGTGDVLDLDSGQLMDLATKKATCPFMGTAVATGALPVTQSATRPLASITDVVGLGDTGGGDLGSNVLTIFANGNHAQMKSSDNAQRLDSPVPRGTLSLDFPGSLGSHPGHSGILEGDPQVIGSGRFDPAAFQRFLGYANNGVIKRSDIGRFIASNLYNDPKAKVFGPKVAGLLGGDIVAFARQLGPALMEQLQNTATGGNQSAEQRNLFIALTTTTGEDNLIGSSGEFGLLMAFLANSPKTTQVAGEPAVSVDDLTSMFRDKTFPAHWQEWRKTSLDWVSSTTAILHAATVQYLFLKASGGSPAIVSQRCSFIPTVQACVMDGNQHSGPVDVGTISSACTAVVTKRLGSSSADSWNCRAYCFGVTMASQRTACPAADSATASPSSAPAGSGGALAPIPESPDAGQPDANAL